MTIRQSLFHINARNVRQFRIVTSSIYFPLVFFLSDSTHPERLLGSKCTFLSHRRLCDRLNIRRLRRSHIDNKFLRQAAANHPIQFLHIYRFGNHIIHAGRQKLLFYANNRICRQCNNWNCPAIFVISASQDPRCFLAIHDRHHVIHQDQIIIMRLLNTFQRFLAISRGLNRNLQRFQKSFSDLQIHVVIIHQKNLYSRCNIGIALVRIIGLIFHWSSVYRIGKR